MAATLHLSAGAAAGQLVVLAGGGFMPPRLLLAPVGAPLPPGVHAVAAVSATGGVALGCSPNRAIPRAAVAAPVGARLGRAVSATTVFALGASGSRALPRAAAPASLGVAALGGSGSRGSIHLLPHAAVPAPGEPAPDDDEGADLVFYDFVHTQGFAAMGVLDEVVPPVTRAKLEAKFTEVKDALARAALLAAKAHPDKMDCALGLVRGCYGMVAVAHAAYPSDGLPPLPGEQAFISMCLGFPNNSPSVIVGQDVASVVPLASKLLAHPKIGDSDKRLINSLFLCVFVSFAAARTARAIYISSDPDI